MLKLTQRVSLIAAIIWLGLGVIAVVRMLFAFFSRPEPQPLSAHSFDESANTFLIVLFLISGALMVFLGGLALAGIRLAKRHLVWGGFLQLLAGLLPSTYFAYVAIGFRDVYPLYNILWFSPFLLGGAGCLLKYVVQAYSRSLFPNY